MTTHAIINRLEVPLCTRAMAYYNKLLSIAPLLDTKGDHTLGGNDVAYNSISLFFSKTFVY